MLQAAKVAAGARACPAATRTGDATAATSTSPAQALDGGRRTAGRRRCWCASGRRARGGRAIGYPVVLKPRAMAARSAWCGSTTPEEVRAQFGFARDTTVPGRLDLRDGGAGRGVADRRGDQRRRGRAPRRGARRCAWPASRSGRSRTSRRSATWCDGGRPAADRSRAADMVHGCTPRSGYTDGMTHTEFRLTAARPAAGRGERPARRRPDPVPGLRASGVDPGLAAAAVACGQRPEIVGDPDAGRRGAVLLLGGGRHDARRRWLRPGCTVRCGPCGGDCRAG